ncbi:MAG: branched-chain amino acid ABC transporter permease [Clostridiales bacterium]|nr:branched-chain amino acid ABC transporter permease [Clostridiales bacterium]
MTTQTETRPEKRPLKETVKTAFKLSLPVMAGYLFIGVAFGMFLSSKGYSAIWAFFLSFSVYAGAMQFVAVELLCSPFSALNAAVMTLSVNARHLFYGLSMLKKYKGTGKFKPYLIFSLTDETYAILSTVKLPENESKGRFYFLLSVFNHLYRLTGSTIGAFFGSRLNFDLKGLDFSMTALFLVVFVEQWQSQKRHLPAITGVLSTLVCLVIFGPDSFIIPSMILITAVLLSAKKLYEKGEAA